jgi:hypothetical protein
MNYKEAAIKLNQYTEEFEEELLKRDLWRCILAVLNGHLMHIRIVNKQI